MNLRNRLEQLKIKAQDDVLKDSSFLGFSEPILQQLKARGCSVYSGKVRDVIAPGVGTQSDHLYMVHSDRLTAFDRFISYIPFKGVILTKLSAWWFETLGSHSETQTHVIPHHFIANPHDRVLKVKSLTPIKVEVVVRGFLAGSMLRAYQAGEREFCGVRLREGLKPFEKLDHPIITPTTKAEAFEHDENSSERELIAKGICTEAEWDVIKGLALRIFALGGQHYQNVGWYLVDTKYEFGKDAQGKIYLMDEVHTPDSSRLWSIESYSKRLLEGLEPTMFDKENIRRYLLSQGFKGYGDVPKVPAEKLLELSLTYLEVYEQLAKKTLDLSTQVNQEEKMLEVIR